MHIVKDEKGSVGVIFGLTALIAFGIVGMAIDIGRIIAAKQHLQEAVDAAVLAGSQPGNLTDEQRKQTATSVFNANMARNSWGTNTSATASSSGGTVTVAASTTVNTVLAHLVVPTSSEAITLTADAGAKVGSGGHPGASGRACILALDEAGQYGIKINGGSGGSNLTANCGVWVNNTTSDGIDGNNNGTIKSSYLCVRGGYDTSTTYKNLSDQITPPISGLDDCPRMDDPFASLTAPTVGACTHNNFKVDKNNPDPLNPGVYCGGINISSKSNVTFNPGIYIIKDGQFTINQGGSSNYVVSGENVLFYLTGTNARFDWGSNSKVQLKGRTEGDYKGMLMWAAQPLSNAHRMGSHNESRLQGAVYSPGTEIDIQCSGNVNAGADWTVWVVKQLQLSSGAALTVNANFTGSATPMPALLETGMVPTPKPARLLH